MNRIILFCIVIFLMLTPVNAQQHTPQQRARIGEHMKQGHQALKAKQYNKAVEYYTKAVSIFPNQAGPWYNMACAFALSGNKG